MIHATPLRLAVNVAAGLDEPPMDVTRQVAAEAASILRLPAETLRHAMQQVLTGASVQQALQWLHEAGLLAVLLPELEATVGFGQEMGRGHKDVWAHTKQVVAQSVPRPNVRWAALLHDVGKVKTRGVTPQGKVTFYGHAELGAQMFDGIAKRLAFPVEQYARVRWLIQHHQRVNQYDGSWSDSAVRRFYRQMGEHLDDLLLLSSADVTSAQQQKRDLARRMIDELRARVAELRRTDVRTAPLPSGLGHAIMSHFNCAAGRQIGQMRALLEHAVEQGELLAGQDAGYYVGYLEQRRSSLTVNDDSCLSVGVENDV